MKLDTKSINMMLIENMITIVVTALCIGMVAIGTGSLWSFLGLALLVNLNSFKEVKNKGEVKL